MMIAQKCRIVTNKIAVKHVFRYRVCATQGVDPMESRHFFNASRHCPDGPLIPEDDVPDVVVSGKLRLPETKQPER